MIPSIRPLRSIVGAVSVLCYLATQCAFAYQPEKTFWAQRRKSAQGLTLTRNGMVKVFESSGLFPPGTVSSLSPLSSPVWGKTVPAGFLKRHRDLFAALPPSAGSVRKVALPKHGSPPGPVIVHIQDVHMNQDAQKNIGAVVGSLMKAGRVNLVALEGSTEEINLQPFADSPHRKAAEMTADYLLQENKISGPIHAAITHSGPLPRILGVDDPAHYQANVQAYLDSVPQREKAQRDLKTRQWEIDDRKKTVYSPALLAFDSVVAKYRNGELSLGEYMEILRETTGLSSNPKGNESVGDFLNAYRTERSLDFKRVELERGQLIEKLTQSLTKTESGELLAHGVAHRSGQLRSGEFYSYLVKLCGTKGLWLTAYPAMDAYVRYLLLADGIDGERLLEEMADLEKEGYALLAKTPEEKDLVQLARREWLTGKLLDFSLIPAEWKEYQGGPRSDSLRAFEAFYEQAQARDRAMVENVFRSVSAPSVPGQVVLLVTGGFHAAGMTDLLTHRGATVVSYVPKIEKIDTAQGSAYLSVFTQEKTPLEKLVEGQKLFLAQNPMSSAVHLKAMLWSLARHLWLEKSGMTQEAIKKTSLGSTLKSMDRWKDFKLYLRNGEVVVVVGDNEILLINEDGKYAERIAQKFSWTKPLKEFHKTIALLFSQEWFERFIAGHEVKDPAHLAKLVAGIQWIKWLTWVGILLTPALWFLWSPWALSVPFIFHLLPHYVHNVLFPEAPLMQSTDKRQKKAEPPKTDDFRFQEFARLLAQMPEMPRSGTRGGVTPERQGPFSDRDFVMQFQLLLARIRDQVWELGGNPELIDESDFWGDVRLEAMEILTKDLSATNSRAQSVISPYGIRLKMLYTQVRERIILRFADYHGLPNFQSYHEHDNKRAGHQIESIQELSQAVQRAFPRRAQNPEAIPSGENVEQSVINLALQRLFQNLFDDLVRQHPSEANTWISVLQRTVMSDHPDYYELGNELGRTRVRIYQIVNQTLMRLKRYERQLKGFYDPENPPGRATGWIGVGVAYGVGWVWGGIKKGLGKMDANTTVRNFAINFVKENNGRRAAIAEDVISTLVAVTVGVWVLSILGPSMKLDWKLFHPLCVAIVWPLLLFRSHVDTERKLQNIFGISPGVPKALMLSGIVFCFTIVVSLVFVALRVQFPLVAEFMIPLFGGASFFVLRAFHKDLNEGKSFQSDDKKISTVIIPLAILGALGFFPEWAEAAVRTGQIVSHGSIAAFLFLILAYLVAQVVSLMRLNNSSARLIRPTEAKAPDVEAPPLDDPAPSIEDRADEETRNAFHRFAVTVGIDPKSARFAPLRVVKGKTGYFERVIFVGGRRFVGLAVINGDSASARIVAPPMSHPSSEHKTQEADLPLPVAPARSVEHFDKGMLIDEPHESATSMASLLRTSFFNYAARNNVDIRGAKISPVRSENSNQASLAVYVGARRYIVEAIRHYSIIGGNIRSRTEVSVSDGDDPLYKKWIAQRSAKEKAERERERLNMWLPPLNSVVRPNNILFLLTGKHPVTGFVIDAVFLLGAAASGAMMGVLLPAFALLHVALEWRKDPGREIKAGFMRFVSHLVFALPYAFLDFSGGIYSLGAWIGAAVAVGIHGAYDAFAIGLSDGRDATKLARGSASERLAVLLGRPVSLSESFKGEILSTSPDLFRRLANEKQSNLYKIGVKIGAAQYKGRSDLVPVIEMPVSNEIELRELLLFIDKVGNLNQSNPEQQRFITVTPQGDMTGGRVNEALAPLNNSRNFVFVKNLTGSITFADYEREFESALAHFGLDPKNMILLLAGRPVIGDLESIRSGDPADSELRRALRNVLFGPWPIVSTSVILEMFNAMALAAKNA